MCQLLGLNCAQPMDARFSFSGFAARGGMTDQHADGFGIGFFDGTTSRILLDTEASARSTLAEQIKREPMKSSNIIAHIRKATKGEVSLDNCHPFMRELWGQHWVFAHNGTLHDFTPEKSGMYQPAGETDSEQAFCALLNRLHGLGDEMPEAEAIFTTIAGFVREVSQHGTFNFLLSNGEMLIAHCSTDLFYVERQWPFSTAKLIDVDLSIDFSLTNDQSDRVAVIATKPLTSDEHWDCIAPGELLMFKAGSLSFRAPASSFIKTPESLKQKKYKQNNTLHKYFGFIKSPELAAIAA